MKRWQAAILWLVVCIAAINIVGAFIHATTQSKWAHLLFTAPASFWVGWNITNATDRLEGKTVACALKALFEKTSAK